MRPRHLYSITFLARIGNARYRDARIASKTLFISSCYNPVVVTAVLPHYRLINGVESPLVRCRLGQRDEYNSIEIVTT